MQRPGAVNGAGRRSPSKRAGRGVQRCGGGDQVWKDADQFLLDSWIFFSFLRKPSF
jgi:hypothetical protein